MGHIGVKGLHSAVDDVPLDDSNNESWEVCARDNVRRSPFPKQSTNRATHLLERIHYDICGPLPPSYGSFSYYILFIDCYFRIIMLSAFFQFQTAAEDCPR